MNVLLDTHVFLWLQSEPERVGPWLERLRDPSTTIALSAASSWELAIKSALGKLPLPEPVATYVPSRAKAIGAQLLAIEHEHALGVHDLPPLHRDPFDRLLIAQGKALGLTLLTADVVLTHYPAAVELVK